MIHRTHRIDPEAIISLPNLITLVRLCTCLGVFAVGSQLNNQSVNIAGLLIYWLLDGLDGFIARRYRQETLHGAQFDILADRILLAFFYFNYLRWNPSVLLPVILFLFNFLVMDHYLSNQYIRWGIISPNYFYEVDTLIWKLNWSAVGKFINTAPFTLLLLITGDGLLATMVILLVLGLKTFSLCRLLLQCGSPPVVQGSLRYGPSGASKTG